MKAQSSLEYISTYSWAILVVLIAIGALAYFGVFSSNKLLPENCILFPGLSCSDFKVDNSGILTLVIQNGMGITLNPFTVTVTGIDTCEGDSGSAIAGLVDGEQETIIITCATPPTNSRFEADLIITYTQESISHTRTGQIIAKVERS